MEDDNRTLTRAERRAYRKKIEKYYMAGTYYGMSVAGQVYMLAAEMERADQGLLW
jgi:cell division control protein 45